MAMEIAGRHPLKLIGLPRITSQIEKKASAGLTVIHTVTQVIAPPPEAFRTILPADFMH
jgi:hypothetical protein